MYDNVDPMYDDIRDREEFADPGGRSALRAATGSTCRSCRRRVGRRDDFCKGCGARLNPRKHPCHECGAKNVLTTKDIDLGYQCDRCADRAEGRYVCGDY